MARLPVPGGDDGVWGEVLNNFLRIEHNPDGSQKTLPLSKGGTGATNSADALSNLGLSSSDGRLNRLYVQKDTPSVSTPYLWIQTGLGYSGSDITFWVEDGQ